MKNYSKIKEIILMLSKDKSLKGKVIIVGGTVPYLISGTISNREHSDIDVIVEEKNMDIIRLYLKNNNLYDTKLDSKEFNYNKEKMDYGVNCIINGTTVNFAPFEIVNNNMIQRNFLSKQSNGINALVTVIIENLKLEECSTSFVIEQVEVRTYSLEMVKLMKEKSNKTKDKIDIEIINEHGYNKEKYNDLKIKTNNMKFKIYPKNKILRLFLK